MSKILAVKITSSLNDFTTEHICTKVADVVFHTAYNYYHERGLRSMSFGSYSSLDNHILETHLKIELN